MALLPLKPFNRSAVSVLALTALLKGSGLAHGDLHERIAALSRRIADSPSDSRLYVERADLHRLHRDWSAVEADLRKAEGLDPGLDSVMLVRARVSTDRGDFAAAVGLADRFLERHPEDGSAMEVRAKALLAMGRVEEAFAGITQAIEKLAAPRPDLHLLQARIQLGFGPEGQVRALAALEAGLRRCPESANLEVEAMELEAALGRIDAARLRLDRLLRHGTRADLWLERWAEICKWAGRHADAQEACRRALSAIEALPPRVRVAASTVERRARLRAELSRFERGGRRE
jgi:tetratricopeptide (TPR) repeat protein